MAAADAIRYEIAFPDPHTHYVDVTAIVPVEGHRVLELMMAVWTPGSYLVREFARHVEGLTAHDRNGVTLAVEKSAKNRWRIETRGTPAIEVRYRIYAREMSVRTNWVESSFALINGAATFLTRADAHARPHEVRIMPAAGWERSLTGLPRVGSEPHCYRAPDYDTLVDSPIVIGTPAVYDFVVGGVAHTLANVHEGGVFDGVRAARDLNAIVLENRRMWEGLPYERYLFLNLITEAGGGLEHHNSCVLMTSRWTTRTRKAYLAWLGLAAHEHFHAWNVKRLRPVELGPFDYEREVHTRSLWIAEGITEYYTDLVVHRAGLSTREEYLEALSSKIEELQTAPGRLVQPAALASFDAWIKYYRPDENSANASISYYTKGAVVAFLLDMLVRRVSGGTRSLDDVMRAAFERYSGARGFTHEEFRTLAEDVAGCGLGAFWDAAVMGAGELDYAEALETCGLRIKAAPAPKPNQPVKGWLGATVRADAGRLLVSHVRRGTPAHAGGLNVDDEIIAIDGFRVRADRWDHRLEQYRAGDRGRLLVARRDALLELDIAFESEPAKMWGLEVDPKANAAQITQLERWLTPTSPTLLPTEPAAKPSMMP